MRLQVAAKTDVGLKRTHNEDNLAIFSEFGLYVVADGMGGHASGEVASKMAIDTLREFFSATSDDPERTWPYKMDRQLSYIENRLVCGIKLANWRIYEAATKDPRCKEIAAVRLQHVAGDAPGFVGALHLQRKYRAFKRLVDGVRPFGEGWR